MQNKFLKVLGLYVLMTIISLVLYYLAMYFTPYPDPQLPIGLVGLLGICLVSSTLLVWSFGVSRVLLFPVGF